MERGQKKECESKGVTNKNRGGPGTVQKKGREVEEGNKKGEEIKGMGIEKGWTAQKGNSSN